MGLSWICVTIIYTLKAVTWICVNIICTLMTVSWIAVTIIHSLRIVGWTWLLIIYIFIAATLRWRHWHKLTYKITGNSSVPPIHSSGLLNKIPEPHITDHLWGDSSHRWPLGRFLHTKVTLAHVWIILPYKLCSSVPSLQNVFAQDVLKKAFTPP